ncbi:uncharacterized protein LOC125499764 [Athalia rosae]|uniref:uncharacterized protein LOC125499764 n=1 Tax=Athalia rosae TaxID=37344 RepID=UPI00203485E2|nr:uncharacterized protein LOC125499764 [Athalia rosae]
MIANDGWCLDQGMTNHDECGKIQLTSDRVKERYDRNVRSSRFEPGKKVWLFQPRRIQGRSPKLQRNWEGPYQIIDRINDVVYRIRKPAGGKFRVIHSDRLALYEGVQDTFQIRALTALPETPNPGLEVCRGISGSRPFTIVVEGNIGAGKSSFVGQFLAKETVQTLLEPVEEFQDFCGVNLLTKLYGDFSRYAFLFQVHALNCMLTQHSVSTVLPFRIME